MAELEPRTSAEDAAAAQPAGPGRSKDEIALELMRFIAVTTGYGKTAQTAGFSAKPSAVSPESHADALLELYGKCRQAIHKPV
ncbi:MAG: hypothetical protein P4L56_00415 [Candidatus Sulfopaludibacter sp.]|nr:hypothetical protein [Candidatus Sulfopaludibacter sp.]